MTDALTKQEYDDALEQYVNNFLEGYDDHDPARQDIIEDIGADANYHNWFARDYYDLTLYASIIEHATTASGREWSDWEVACDAGSPEQVVKRLALVAFENDATERALHHAGLIGPDAEGEV